MIMKNKTLWMLATALALVGHATVGTTADSAGMAFGRSQAPAPLEGTWVVTIRPIVCGGPSAGTDVPGVTPVKSHLTFGRGGTLVESTSNPNLGVGSRTAGGGWWERTGQTSYQFAFQAFLVSPPAPYRTGLQRIDQTIELHSNDDWTSSGSVQFFETFDLNDNPGLAPYRAGCARATGVRMY
jgi:hypothetical protein